MDVEVSLIWYVVAVTAVFFEQNVSGSWWLFLVKCYLEINSMSTSRTNEKK